jgi:glycosyltransferase involved in cell wall biosynthesis
MRSPQPPGVRRPVTNVVLVSHCDFGGNSALHALAIAVELHGRGFSPVIAVPDNAESVQDVGRPPFPVLTYEEVLGDSLRFDDGRGPDLIYAFSPRELVRGVTVELVRSHGCAYVVHLEDNDEVVLAGELGGTSRETLRALPLPTLDRIVQSRQSHPLRATRFLERAAGVTVLVDRLLELVPEGVPAAVLHAGFDEVILAPSRPRGEVRSELGLADDDLAIVYPGNVHSLNRDEMRDLFEAVEILRRAGERVVLVKTGKGSGVVAADGFPSLGDGIRDLGWVARSAIPELLAAADVLVQPGGPGPFNDYRFPSKVPEYLASGRPVVLPRTNIGLELRDGEEALLLDRGDATEIAEAVARLGADPPLRQRLGEGGRSFALRKLRWSSCVDRLEALLREIQAENRTPAPAWALDGADPPAKLVAIVPELPSNAAVRHARSHGVFGFCLDSTIVSGDPAVLELEAPYCVRVDGNLKPAVADFLDSGAYICAGGNPIVLLTDGNGVVRTVGSDGVVEELPDLAGGYEHEMRRRLTLLLPEHAWYRTLLPPQEQEDVATYSVWLRKLVLQTALRARDQAPLLFVDASAVWPSAVAREAWLAATRTGMSDGIRQFYASQGLRVSPAEADEIVRSS